MKSKQPNSHQSKFFHADWYAWQNPDWNRKHSNPFDHYREVGVEQLRDPSPLVDMRRYDNVVGKLLNKDYFSAINEGFRDRAFGVYEDYNELEESQTDFHKNIEVYTHKFKESNRKCKGLVFVQAGPLSLHNHWYDHNLAEFDLLINYYNPAGFDLSVGDYIFSQVGTKFTAFARLYQEFESMFSSYDFVYLLDDDIYIDTPSINQLFTLCKNNNAEAAQPSLTSNSHCIWPVFFNKGTGVREVNGVEIMMPVLSRELMSICAHKFYESVSGFGLDLLIRYLVQQNLPGKMYVFDSIQAVHDKPIDDSSGAYYENMRKNLINPKAELWNLVERYSLSTDFSNMNNDMPVSV